ncbi:hypothetical protein GCM10018785_55880 [Streptomyces longispororuber]|uniref:Uncharacterized protein n=1 Tax=Streptomyces longispororuber TaxID=68230 RepID=A0A918ZZV6_9ACTN|nr:hypothetical protein GCM10018785_55880 [Streptomyces longispororuber]
MVAARVQEPDDGEPQRIAQGRQDAVDADLVGLGVAVAHTATVPLSHCTKTYGPLRPQALPLLAIVRKDAYVRTVRMCAYSRGVVVKGHTCV